ncbi:sugar ABC transporter permease [Thermotoga sp. 38H-to]|uniref:carbohydrate ABC transporter permease n=1 Tax=Thermotoga sp. 38H-to TaxID=1755812 RepID=UPI0013ED85BA|nr:sugar ABC transporter permease [Thermotoga sp. 38H-to]KAF2959109.1 hypothetical protein AS158_08675 [Thermotoga sp. 38H-to]
MYNKRKKKITAFLFTLPAVALFLFYFLIPIPMTFFYSFFRWEGFSLRPDKFVGFGNWYNLFSNEVTWRALLNNLKFIIYTLLIQIPIGIGLGLLISSKIKGTNFMRIAFFIPLLIPSTTIAIIWKIIYDPYLGFLNNFLKILGLEKLAKIWLGDPEVVVEAIYAATSWQWIPFYMIIFAAALTEIPKELYEAAMIDGATSFKRFIYITLPFLKRTIITAAILGITGSLKYFDLVYILTEGGPGNTSELLATYMYKLAFRHQRMGYASAYAFFLFGISLVISILMYRVYRRGDTV